jgi:membrane-bound serine protease (ClpP class)
MNIVILLFLLGLVFLFIEIFAPGGVFGVIGGLTFVAGIVVAGSQYGLRGGLIAGAVAIVAVCATLYAELVWLPKTRFAQRFAVRSTSGATINQVHAEAAAVVGKTAEAVTTLAPSGYVSVEGRRYEAFCQSGLAEKGAQLRVTGLDNFRVIVTKI